MITFFFDLGLKANSASIFRCDGLKMSNSLKVINEQIPKMIRKWDLQNFKSLLCGCEQDG